MKSIPNVLRLLAASLTCASLLHAETETAPIPFSEIGAKATADYQGDAIDITRTREGARLHTGFQKLVGNVTPEGLTLVSTEEGGGSLKLTATSIGRELADAPSPLLLPTSGKVSGNNPFANAAATWALLHQLTLYCLYSDLQRPGGDPPGLLTETFTTTGGGYLWATFSGQPGGQGNADGTGAAARFDNPAGIISDNNGGFFVADSNNHVIRRVYSSGVVTPFAGSTQMFGSSNGTGNAASFHGPAGLALKPVGFLVVANVLNSTIRQMSPSGEVTLQAGSPGVAGSQSGTGTGTRFSRPAGIVIRADLPRPGGNSPGLLTEAVTDTNSQTFYIVVDTANLPTLDVTGLGIDTNNPANIAALDNIASAGIRVVGAENTLPTAAATFTVLDPIDRTVSLNGSASSDPDGDIVSYTWSWNGGSATGINPIANFALGETQVTLTVTDNRGGTSSTTLTVVIPEPPSGMAQVAYIKASNTGAAYVFSRIGTEWNQLAYLKPSNRATEDFFGFGVALSGTTAVVSAFGEDSSAMGVGGNQDSNASSQSGAAYVFHLGPLAGATGGNISLATALSVVGLAGDDAAFSATPFNDGVENMLKYAFNMNLAGPDSATMEAGGNAGLPIITPPESGSAGIFRYEFLRRTGSGLVYTPKKNTSLDPSGWTTLTDTPTIIPIDVNWERVIYEEPADPEVISNCYGRVEVRIP